MRGTFLNALTVLAGGSLGLVAGKKLSPGLQTAVMNVLGLFTCVLGINMAFDTRNPLVLLGSLVAGTAAGEFLNIEARLERLGELLQRRFSGSGPRTSLAGGFVAASLLFCVGPMSITGAIQDGLTGDYRTLAVKAVMDGFASIILASSLGAGVLLSVLTILTYQGAITLAAGLVQRFLSAPMIAELTATGGVLIVAIGIGLLDLKKMKVGNMLPALLAAPILQYLAGML